MTNKERILAISKELGLSHIGSNLSCLSVLEEIYAKKRPEDIVILDNAHAHLAHLVIQSAMNDSVKEAIRLFGIHCDRQASCDASGGSLGHGLGIGIGYALADRNRDVYVIVSDGSMAEGSNWEALRIAQKQRLDNLHIYCNFNGYTAVAVSSPKRLYTMMHDYAPLLNIKLFETENGEGFEGVQGHYKKI